VEAEVTNRTFKAGIATLLLAFGAAAEPLDPVAALAMSTIEWRSQRGGIA
jgi:hypothetical protein